MLIAFHFPPNPSSSPTAQSTFFSCTASQRPTPLSPSRSQCRLSGGQCGSCCRKSAHTSTASLIAPPHIVQKPIPAISHKEKMEHDPPSAFGKHVSCITARWRVLASVQMLCLKAAAILPRSRLHNKSQIVQSSYHHIWHNKSRNLPNADLDTKRWPTDQSYVHVVAAAEYTKRECKEKRQTRGGGGGGDKSTLPTVLSSRPIGSKALKLMTLWKGKGQNCIQRETPQDVVHDGLRLQQEAI